MKMADGNTAALRQHESQAARTEQLRDGVIPDLVETVMDGGVVRRQYGPRRSLSAMDIIEHEGVDMFVDAETLANLLCGDEEARERVRERLRKLLEERTVAYFEGPGESYVQDAMSAAEEDGR